MVTVDMVGGRLMRPKRCRSARHIRLPVRLVSSLVTRTAGSHLDDARIALATQNFYVLTFALLLRSLLLPVYAQRVSPA